MCVCCSCTCGIYSCVFVIGNVSTAPENTVRLADGPNAYTGRVEVYINGTWGTVCDDGWNINAGHVVCRQLGFSRATAVHEGGEFGPGTYYMHMYIHMLIIYLH